jgi:hypothetical protein
LGCDGMDWMGDEAVLFLQLLARHGRMGGKTLPRVEVRDRTLIAWGGGGLPAGRRHPVRAASSVVSMDVPLNNIFFGLLEIIWERVSVGRYCTMCYVYHHSPVWSHAVGPIWRGAFLQRNPDSCRQRWWCRDMRCQRRGPPLLSNLHKSSSWHSIARVHRPGAGQSASRLMVSTHQVSNACGVSVHLINLASEQSGSSVLPFVGGLFVVCLSALGL